MKGAITFLDILGWKSIWQRLKDDPENNPMKILHNEINVLKEDIDDLLTNNMHYQGIEMKVLSISDTIVMYNESDDCGLSLNFHARNTVLLITRLLKKSLPLRGATCFGEFDVIDNIYMGPAIEEVATWYEAVNWIGSILTPSAMYECATGPFDEFAFVDYSVPTKQFGNIDTKCVNWLLAWEVLENKNENDLKKEFQKMGPITPDIALKYINTLKYYEYVKEKFGEEIEQAKNEYHPPHQTQY